MRLMRDIKNLEAKNDKDSDRTFARHQTGSRETPTCAHVGFERRKNNTTKTGEKIIIEAKGFPPQWCVFFNCFYMSIYLYTHIHTRVFQCVCVCVVFIVFPVESRLYGVVCVLFGFGTFSLSMAVLCQ